MRNRLIVPSVLAMFTICLCVAASDAAPPWADLVRMRRIEADANKTYTLTNENGPWLIMATTFRGPDSVKDAQALVLELRRDYKLLAYAHSATYDYSKGFVGRGVDRYGDPKRMRHLNNEKIEEVAVMVGDYASVDDPRAQKDLQRLKTFQPKTLDAGEGRKTSQTFSQLREVHRKLLSRQSDKKSLGPMRLAFVTTNPLVSASYFRPQGIDRFVASLNASKKYSLLECPDNYTVKVATFNGYVATNANSIKSAQKKHWSISNQSEEEANRTGAGKGLRSVRSRLEQGAYNANKLTLGLRAKGYEAYQFHDRNSSIVTVGSFHRPPTQRADGSAQHEPQVQNLIHRFGAKAQQVSGGPSPTSRVQPQMLVGIPFDVLPTLIPVPKRSLSRDLAQ